MLRINIAFDEELGPGGLDPLGKLIISDGETEILIDTTYLDSWLTGLIDGLQQLRTKTHVIVESEEPTPIEMDIATDGRLIISHNGKKVVAGGLKELEFALRIAVNRFLSDLKDSPEASQNRLIDPIRRFWATTQN